MRRTIGSRFLSVFLAIVLMLSSVNVTVFAEAQENAGDGTESTIETMVEPQAQFQSEFQAEPITEPAEPQLEPTEEPQPEITEESQPEITEEPQLEPTEEPQPEPTEEPQPEPTEEPASESQPQFGSESAEGSQPQFGSEPAEEPKIEPQDMELYFSISWYNGENAAQKRPEISGLLELYANGTNIALPDVVLLNGDQNGDGAPDPDLAYGLETYHYRITVPDVDENGDAITYTLKQNSEKLQGQSGEETWAYQPMDYALLELSEGDLQSLKASALTPESTLTFQEDSWRFVNYLPVAVEEPKEAEEVKGEEEAKCHPSYYMMPFS